MIDKRIGERIKQCREQLGLTQEQFAERLGLTTNYISTVERGASFPRCEKLIAIINGLETSADAIFCDVITHTSEYRSGILSEELKELPAEEQQRILEIVELMIKQDGLTHFEGCKGFLRPFVLFRHILRSVCYTMY